ncbi:sensor histidine kinase [Rubellimicrobium roseum]|uniref:histidine kinase n=1 Tax=Rubellimicrobium roseum TaxID=687525 RepID=A0A5C4NCP4_9RHOB|nr:PAS domain-containing sensor histidine kinase [Rubellimicrobium roseum]TNC68813.1 PAS domain S-box protein [Rubellimicrobium roseum]
MFQRLGLIDDAFDAIAALVEDGFAICSLITDPEGRPVDYRFLRVNRRFEEMTGLRDVEGRTALELIPNLERRLVTLYGHVAQAREPARFRTVSALSGRDYEVVATPIEAPDGFAILFRDVTELARAEAEREAELQRAQHLLAELNHRVMNSFAAISSIVALEMRAAPPEARPPLERLQGRVQALGALYRRLDGASRADRIDVADYLGGNVASFRDALGAAAGVEITADVAPLTLPTRLAVPLGLVVNELVTNAVKHAFAPGQPGHVHVSLAAEGDLWRLTVADDGGGLGGTQTGGSGIGHVLVAAFVAELGGEMSVESGPRGTTTTVDFRV